MTKFLNLFSLSALAAMVALSGTPVTALVAENHAARHAGHHAAVAHKKRATATCKPRIPTSVSSSSTTPSSTYAAPSTTAAPQSSSSAKKHSSSAAPPASTSSSSSGGSSSGGSAGSGKVGIAWANGNDDSLKNFVTSKTQFLYTWSPSLPDNLHGLTGVPMLWGYNQIDEFKSTVKAGYSTHVLGMNEPNEVGQSNMSPADGAQLWKEYIDPLKNEGYTLISPAPSSRPNGFDWVGQFLGNCTGCQVDRIALHYYDITAQGFIDWVTKFHDAYDRPIWITEFADQNFNGPQQQSQDEVNSFFSTVLGWMDSTPWVEQYFAFGIMTDMQGVSATNQLMTSDGQPTALGYQYIYS
jgi:hypothetical protein